MKLSKEKLQLVLANECMSMEDFADKVKVSRTSISKYLSGAREPRPKTIGKIAKALDVPVEKLIDLDGE